MAEPTPLPIRPPRDRDVVHQAHRTDDPIAPLVERMLGELGEDSNREGLLRTPDRVSRSLRFLVSGYDKSVAEVVNGAVFAEPYEQMVLVRDIEMYSLCEHHLLPFYGKAHVAYLPRGKIIGLSKLPRVVEVFARRLQVQERLTTEIANALDEVLSPYGVAVVIEASHLCMMMRGVEKQNSRAVTSALTGAFHSDPKCRNEFLDLLGRT
ncbi:MAG: GTP cyclohydrolase I FolE [Candidatus Dormibacteraeota bacterium]|uniref:GTP cyclohydrolase 1 n=1 Tax=Candidatus Amunia macphersoniae TaxID=3127014 RepID=A0A934NFH6_9BACT|nr:GTP cyclohydrolase I FolE [Candidatus Dormibacteraeota bacterium]